MERSVTAERTAAADELARTLREAITRLNRRVRQARPVGDLTFSQLSALTSLQLSAMSSVSLRAIESTDLRAITTAAIAGLNDEIHRQEKSIVGVQAQAERATSDEARLQQRADLVQSEVNRAKEEIAGLDARHPEILRAAGASAEALVALPNRLLRFPLSPA